MTALRIANKVPSLPRTVPFLSAAIRSGGHVFCSGQIGSTPDGEMVEGPIGKRVDQIMDNLDAVLKAHGSSLDHTVKFNLYQAPPTTRWQPVSIRAVLFADLRRNTIWTNLTDSQITSYKDFDAINAAYTRRIPTPPPARSCIGVANLPRGTDIEIECIAVVPPRAKL
ncbi:hypothetical protein EHS25_000730 [Saitozyma podzolica]|uniref:Uncharacterized protein n=1 Tax=Saitozyma podzolica TaxID=1890683 RepID=A0A427YX29_9TREE|nr:hypothetical protein EHS25_000730 [Saitozyma podzolica]